MPVIIGTAGHIDHGKTALIKALTGQDTDRLKEEKERGISIDLGFAYFERPDGSRDGVVDVPGHEHFIRNMLAGAHGVDLVLLVVAADDGVMPQTEEHAEILHLLGVRRGIVVITKSDLVDAARIAQVAEEVRILLAGTSLDDVPLVPVSSATGAGMDRLREEIERALSAMERRAPSGYFRLPIDRAFVMKGHGVVVTGTAISGAIADGAALRLLPGGEECRARGLQVHGAAVKEARAGQRVAVNLGGVDKTDVTRGHVLADAALTSVTDRIDALVEIRPTARRTVKNHSPLRVHLGTAESLGRMIILDDHPALAPKQRAFCQLVLQTPVVAAHGDRFILRDQAAQRTLGGGVVLQPFAVRHRPGDRGLEGLALLRDATTLAEKVGALVRGVPEVAVPLEWLCGAVNQAETEVIAALRGIADLVVLPRVEAPEVVARAGALASIQSAAVERLAAFHRANALAPGMEMESMRSQIAAGLSPKLFRVLVDALARNRALVREESVLRLPSHNVALGAADRELAAKAEATLAAAGITPPDLKQLESGLRALRKRLLEILAQLEREGRVVRVGPELYFSRGALDEARGVLERHLKAQGEITAATFRDLIGASRKFSIALLDYFDRTGFTLRVGDIRKLRRTG